MAEYLYTDEIECDFSKVYGILYACPAINRRKNCPINVVEHLAFIEKLMWFDGLDAEKKDSILAHHTECSRKRNEW